MLTVLRTFGPRLMELDALVITNRYNSPFLSVIGAKSGSSHWILPANAEKKTGHATLWAMKFPANHDR